MTTGRTREVSALDVTRLLAAQAVMFYHLVFLSWAEAEHSRGIRAVVGNPAIFADATGWASLGWVGVPIFFVISGFVILMSAENKSATDFLIGRIARIFPGLWFFSLVSALVLFLCGVLQWPDLTVRLLRSMTLFPVGPWVDGAVWTLVTEAVFYAAVFALIRTGAIHRLTPVMLGLTAFNLVFWSGVLAGEAGLLGPAGHKLAAIASSYKLRVTLITTNTYFVAGAALYQVFMRRNVAVWAPLFMANYLTGLVSTYYAARSSVGVSQFGQDPLAATAVWGVLALLMAVCVLRRVGSGPRFARFATIAGLLTYPLYLINQIIGGGILGLAYRTGLPPALCVALTALACTALAGAFALLLERRLQVRLIEVLKRFAPPSATFKEA